MHLKVRLDHVKIPAHKQDYCLLIDYIFKYPLVAPCQETIEKVKQKSGKKEEDGQRGDFTEKNARSEGESACVKASHLAFI